jgi:hypothetical protein
MKMRMNVPPRVLGKVQFRELGEATVMALTGGQARENGNAGATHGLYAHVAKLHCSSAADCFASAWPWKGGRCMRTLARFETGGAPLKGLARKRPVMTAKFPRRDRQAFLYKNCSIRSAMRTAPHGRLNANDGELLLERRT